MRTPTQVHQMELAHLGVIEDAEDEFTKNIGLFCMAHMSLMEANPAHFVKCITSRYDEFYSLFNGGDIRSPIEQLMAAWLVWLPGPGGGFASSDWASESSANDFVPNKDCVLILPQAQIGKYRADFLLTVCKAGTVERFVIECDGHDYHERTKEQAAHDKSRDRSMTLDGYTVLRFTGSEIVKAPNKCFNDILTAVMQASRLKAAA